jgi:hypothetical protein
VTQIVTMLPGSGHGISAYRSPRLVIRPVLGRGE